MYMELDYAGRKQKNAQGSAPAPAGPSVGVFRLLSQRG